MRMYVYVKKLKAFKVRFEAPFLLNCIRQGITFCSRLIHCRTKHKTSKVILFDSLRPPLDGNNAFENCVTSAIPTNFGKCALNTCEVMWIGFAAFKTVFEHRRDRFSELIAMMTTQMNYHQRLHPGEVNLLISFPWKGFDCDEALKNSIWI
mmetsp:Transcript_16691/g.22968  ORF Transcript_16691/g.22968 Transcript_16691/m.22968 type:complete len:151 (+) Transcript_16691:2-454(+)